MNWIRWRVLIDQIILCAILSACAVYHAAPLSVSSPLRGSLGELSHRLPDGRLISSAPPLSLRDVAALAVLNDPDLVAARTQHGVAQADLLSAGLLPDPSVSVGFASLISGPGNVPAISGSIAQDLSALITYHVGAAAARAGLAAVDAGILWQEWQVAGEAEALCIAIGADDEIVASLQADAAALGQVNAATQAQVGSGNLTLASASASMAALAANQTALNTAIQTRAQDVDQLDALLGLRPGNELPVVLPALTPISPAVAAQAIVSLPTRRPDLIALRFGYEQADAKLRGAILTQFLPITIGGTGGRDTTNVWSAGPQLTLSLPLFNRNRGGIATANAARAQLAAQFAASVASTDASAAALLARIGVLKAESTAADAQAQTAAVIAAQSQAAFSAGSLDAQSAVNLQTAAGDRRRESITLRAQLAAATLALNTMLGIGLPPIVQPVMEPSP